MIASSFCPRTGGPDGIIICLRKTVAPLTSRNRRVRLREKSDFVGTAAMGAKQP